MQITFMHGHKLDKNIGSHILGAISVRDSIFLGEGAEPSLPEKYFDSTEKKLFI